MPRSESKIPTAQLLLTAGDAPDTFHARFDARAKTYRYRIWNGEVPNPFEREYAWHLHGTLDVGSMAAAAPGVEGRHDFAAFQCAGGATRSRSAAS